MLPPRWERTNGPPEVRFLAKVNQAGPVPDLRPDLGPCWLWTGRPSSEGYGVFWTGERVVKAARWSYEAEHGPLPPGYEPDHLCRVRACVRPSHLEGVTKAANILRGNGMGARNARKTHCPAGHAYTPENTYSRPSRNERQCRTCHPSLR